MECGAFTRVVPASAFGTTLVYRDVNEERALLEQYGLSIEFDEFQPRTNEKALTYMTYRILLVQHTDLTIRVY